MIAVICRFELAASITSAQARQYFADSANKFVHLPGLIRKYFLLAEDGQSATSVYLWESRAAAEAFHSESWKEFIQGKYGYYPSVTYYECPVVVDNRADEVLMGRVD